MKAESFASRFKPLPIPRGGVHIWLFPTNLEENRTDSMRPVLTAEERARADRFHFQRDQIRSTVSRFLLRSLAGVYTGQDPARLVLHTTEHGKPVLADCGGRPELSFNVSHSGDWGMAAVAHAPQAGVDIERIRAGVEVEKIANRFFTAQEEAWLLSHSEEERDRAFYRLWTVKEAVLKAEGSGLSLPLDVFSAVFEPELRIAFHREQPHEYAVREIAAPPGYQAAVALAGVPECAVSLYEIE